MSDPLSDKVRRLSGQIWQRMADAHRRGLQYYETTSTETLLLSLCRQLDEFGLHIQAFTQREERTTGADWEFLFQSSRRFFQMRVQAKRLYLNDYQYGSLGPIPNSPQHQALVNNSDGSFSAYLLYNSDVAIPGDPLDAPRSPLFSRRIYWEGRRNCRNPRFHAPTYWGCALKPARTMPSGSKFHAGELMPMLPLHCLFCSCRGVTDLVTSVTSAFRNFDDRVGDLIVAEAEMLPEWVLQLLHGPVAPETQTLLLEKKGLAGLVWIRESEGALEMSAEP